MWITNYNHIRVIILKMKHSDLTQMLYVHLIIFVQKCTVSGGKMTYYKPDEQDSIPDKCFIFLFPIWNYSLAHCPIHYMPVVPFLPLNVAVAWSFYPNSYHDYEHNDLNGLLIWPHESVNENGYLAWGKSRTINLMGMYAHCLFQMLEALRCFAMMDVTNLSRECTDNTNVNSG